ncbi:glycosylphosphatidylinositol-alpha 1,4 mannosyltransferase I [Saccharomycopsis crataegensis]|uniref:GPI mannosyltransferase 1 n=1 Tax=Saccharomycopsis crataegensis TaxID=43959 RepID=A0AAV5QPA1_9ASCO|nr:glycosylphosphatidylinositol-alpha 1,4 mannosyltransferase I [Saccharomycopsis crataegensis]
MTSHENRSIKETNPVSRKNHNLLLIVVAFLLRIGFFLFGLYQDATMEVKYTDIDYVVFTDAARYVYKYNRSPYSRETYRYTPLLAYLLVPTAIEVPENEILELICFSFGKFVFIISDLITGILILKLLDYFNRDAKKSNYKNLVLSAIWLLNPMVITISTRGSSESFLTVLLTSFLYFLIVKQNIIVSAIFFAISIHYKLYPIIYFPTVILYLVYKDINLNGEKFNFQAFIVNPILKSISKVLLFTITTLLVFFALGAAMYQTYGYEFLYNSYLYHFIRTDHRHNFSIYNMSLYFKSSLESDSIISIDFTKFAFIPQFLVSAIIIPLLFNFNFKFQSQSKSINKDKAMLLLISFFLQTFAFVNYNKVITSQYFIWYMVFLPFYLESSTLLKGKKLLGLVCLMVWILGQALWLLNAYNLEFLGISTFYPWLFVSSALFFVGNTWMLGVFIDDVLSVYF